MRTLQLDLHTHAKVARRVAFNPADALRYARTLRSRGLDGLAITEHAHGADFWAMYDALLARWPYRQGRFEIEGALFFTGMELTLAERVDALIVAPLETLRALDEALLAPATAGYHPTGEELAAALQSVERSTLRIAAHPFRDDKHIEQLAPALRVAIFHAVEINACYADAVRVEAVLAKAAQRGWATTAGSDAHTWPQLGACWTSVEVQDDSFEALRQAVLARRCAPRTHPQRARLVRTGRALKARCKARSPRIEKLPWRTCEGLLVEGAPPRPARVETAAATV